MYGWRARIGLMIPSLNVTAEPEFNQMAPDGVSVHTARLLMKEGSPEDIEKLSGYVEQAAELLATACVDVIAFACTTGSLIRGIGWDKELITRIEKTSKTPAVTTSTAVIKGFRELGIKRVAVATPYIEELNRKEKDFFEGHGVKVVNIKGLGSLTGEELHKQPPETTYRLAKEVDTPEADGLFISCTDFKTITIIECLEKDLKKPVFSSNTATMWATLIKVGIRGPIDGYGELLKRL